MTENEKLQRHNDIDFLYQILTCYIEDCISTDKKQIKQVEKLYTRITKGYLAND